MSKLQVDTEERMELLTYLETVLESAEGVHGHAVPILADVEATRNNAKEDLQATALPESRLGSLLLDAKRVSEDTVCWFDDVIGKLAGSEEYLN